MKTSVENVADLSGCIALYVPSPGWLWHAGCEVPEDPRTQAANVWIADETYRIWWRFFPDDIRRLLADLEQLELDQNERQKRVGSVLHTSRSEHRAEILVWSGYGHPTRKLTLASWWLNQANRLGLAERIDKESANLKPEEYRHITPEIATVGGQTFFIFLEGCRKDDLRPCTIVRPPGWA